MWALESEAIKEEGQTCQSFLWAYGGSRGTYVPHTVINREHVSHRSSDGCSTTDHQPKGSHPLTFSSNRPTMAAHPTGTKQQHCSLGCEMGLDQSGDEPTSCPKEPPQWRQKEEDPLAGCLKGAHQEAFRKDSNLVKQIRQTYFRAHHLEFDSEITHDLACVFKEMADIVSLLNTEIHQVQDPWPGKKELCTANHAAMSSTKDICCFQVVSLTESPKGIHSPEALKCQGGLSFCPGVGRRGRMRALPWTTSILSLPPRVGLQKMPMILYN